MEADLHSTKLRRLIEQMAGQRLPGERELSERLGVSRSRLRTLLDQLETEGSIERRQGSGTYAIATQKPETVAILIDEALKIGEDPFFSQLLEHLQLSLQADGIRCEIERFTDQQPSYLLRNGAITLGQAGKAVLERLRPGDPPVVGLLLNLQLSIRGRASIFQLADREAGQEAARRLLMKHCQTLLLVGRDDIFAARERLAGAAEVARAAEIPHHLIHCHLNYTAGLKLGRSLELPAIEGPLGIIAANDWLALGLQAGLLGRGETNTHIVSFDGLALASDSSLEIASLVVPIEAIATDAIAELRRLHHSKASVGRIVRYQLYWQASDSKQ
jgi:DNA-binding LacI/PurR family transcriptional regulator